VSGKQLIDRLAQVIPDLKVLCMSGYADNAIAHHGNLAPDTPFIPKPFTLKDLLTKVREVLDN
jgi:FixJ family two-component response regulator